LKLSTKLTLFVTLSKLAIVLFFVLTLPYVVDYITIAYTDNLLQQQKAKVLRVIDQNGIDFYLDGQESYGSYTLLREEFIALEPVDNLTKINSLETDKRIIERDTLNYRILSHTFKSGNQNYLLEVAKATSTMTQYSRPLQRMALYLLLSLILVTLIIDLVFTHQLIKPLRLIIKNKLVNQRFPSARNQQPIETSTSDFRYLDNSLILLMDQINDAFEKEREFTANASHELMTPISILQNKIENLMEDEDVSDLIRQRFAEMMRTLNRLKKIVNSLLLISRIENEQFAKSDDVEVRMMAEGIRDEICHRLEDQEISFELKFQHLVSLKNVNHDLLFQLFYNLINNAIRYNKHKGSIVMGDEFINGRYAIFVKDTGIGIPDDEISTIFNRFKKANLSQTGGYGLGLSIVKSIANYHQITLEVVSVINEGTTFKVIFPNEQLKINE
jgi:signal transduction histidine kinase